MFCCTGEVHLVTAVAFPVVNISVVADQLDI